VLIDCPPNFNIVTKTAIAASEHLLVPTKPDYLSTLGIEQLASMLRRWRKLTTNIFETKAQIGP
jgi:chromosome partitioning protein